MDSFPIVDHHNDDGGGGSCVTANGSYEIMFISAQCSLLCNRDFPALTMANF